ncbi:hypothetical protein DXV75_15130 [Alteromonas aestuariivivens]|uniref:Uncharacterized protein n=1 Tax=Alteromonas aestuariivivens TaxID=1938339 RepID=A0A3D8M361_9ALTE|nr:DUF6524 family protein [Alteromonas aestuariivivens]RDV24163.1 hypothetical protein DXV75_15130 [Alteromonas aestuariivivens]
MASAFNAGGFLRRVAFALALVLGTYNPTHYSFVSWVTAEGVEFGPVILIVGVILLIAWIIYLRATFMSLGWLGIALGAALLGGIVWWFVDIGLLSLQSEHALSWIILVLIAVILAVGMSWSHIRRNMTGQVDTDDLDDGRG